MPMFIKKRGGREKKNTFEKNLIFASAKKNGIFSFFFHFS
jgi:hypothetical protein